MNNSVIETLLPLPSSKSEVMQFAGKLRQELNDGTITALGVARIRKCIEQVFKDIHDDLTPLMREEFDKYGGKTIELMGMKIEGAEVGVSYDYTGTGDPVLLRLVHEAEVANNKLKERQTFLKGLKEKTLLGDPERGEIHEVYPPIKSSTSSVKITLI